MPEQPTLTAAQYRHLEASVARDLRELANEIDNAAVGDHAATGWAKDIRRIAKKLSTAKET